MSINSCTINCLTINSICKDRRQAIIDTLLPKTLAGGQQQHVNPDTHIPLSIFRRDTEENTIDLAALESNYMSVSIELNGTKYSQTLERDNNVPMINIYALKLDSLETITISDITIRIT